MMKSLFLTVAFALTSLLLWGQNDPIDAFFQEYKGVAEATQIDLGGMILDFAISNADDEEEANLLRKISKLKVLTIPRGDLVSPEKVMELRTAVMANDFEELIQVRDEGDLVSIFMREADDSITNLLLLVEEEDEFVFVSLEGAFSFSDLQELDLDVDGMDNLQNVPSKEEPRP